jgi:hypothetical protein
MCDDRADAPEAWRETIRRARKSHHCCACKEVILPGDRYHYSSGVWDGSGGDFKHCLRCWKMFLALQNAMDDVDGGGVEITLDCGENWLDTIGDLPEDVAALAFMTRAEMQVLYPDKGGVR